MTTSPYPIRVSNANILVVDDSPHQNQDLENLLTSQGYQVKTALGGRAACKKLVEQQFDLVLLDLNIQDINGHKVMEFMAKRSIDTATIVVSGKSSFTDVSKALRRGAYDYLKKPYDPEELIATIKSALWKKLMESTHEVMQRKLQRSEELHRYIVNNSPDIVFMLDKRGCFTFLNNKIERILAYDKKHLLGQHYSTIIAKDDIEKATYLFGQVDANQLGIKSFELHLKRAEQSQDIRFFEITLFPVERNITNYDTHGKKVKTKKYIGIYGTARDITDKKEAEEFINFQAYHDLLTRLPNRALFKDRLNLAIAQAKRSGENLALMFLDLDRFKIVNDTLGHSMGDHLLQAVANRMEGCIREGDTLARFGGDEFTLLLPEISGREDARKIARKLINVLKEPFVLGDHDVFVGVSIGIAMYPQGGTSQEQLIKNADIAMYHVKGRGKDGYQFFVDSMNTPTFNRLKLERDLRHALDKNELDVYYQPLVNAHSNEIIGVEALVRWNHPEKGLIYPADFLPLAEETKLIIDISEWVLETACKEVKNWIDSGHKDIRLAINCSPTQIEHPRFVENLIKQLEKNNFPSRNLELELTENVIMSDLERMNVKLNSLAEQGITIAIDDFGTGYSSLNYLNKLPINTLKVDQSFIRDIQNKRSDACIVNAIISMARGLKLNIVAEGVENAVQLEYLRSLGCHELQGFLFGKARPAKETLHIIDNQLHCQAV